MKTRRRGISRGQAVTEFALILPIFAMLLFGIIDMSRFVYSSNALNEAAREAARQGTVALRPSTCTSLGRVACVKALVHQQQTAVPVADTDIHVVCYRIPLTNAPPTDAATEADDNCGSTWKAGDLVRVQIRTNFALATPVIAQIFSPTILGNATWVTVNG